MYHPYRALHVPPIIGSLIRQTNHQMINTIMIGLIKLKYITMLQNLANRLQQFEKSRRPPKCAGQQAQLNQQQPQSTYKMHIRYSSYLKAAYAYDYHEKHWKYFKQGQYTFNVLPTLFIYKYDNEIIVSKSFNPVQYKYTLLCWLKIEKVQTDFVIHFKKNSELHEYEHMKIIMPEMTDQTIIIDGKDIKRSKYQETLQQAYGYGSHKFMIPNSDSLLSSDLQTPPQYTLRKPLPDFEILFIVRSYEQFVVEEGMRLIFGKLEFEKAREICSTDKWKYIRTTEFQVKKLELKMQFQPVYLPEVISNPRLPKDNQNYLIHNHCLGPSQPEDSRCVLCFREASECSELARTMIKFCSCSWYCIQCLCQWIKVKIEKPLELNHLFNTDNNQQYNASIQIHNEKLKCKTCKQPIPQYVSLSKGEGESKQYYRLLKHHRFSKILFYDKYRDCMVQKQLFGYDEIGIGCKPESWLETPLRTSNQNTSLDHASIRRSSKNIVLMDKNSKWGTFAVLNKPTITIPMKGSPRPIAVQINNTIISFSVLPQQ